MTAHEEHERKLNFDKTINVINIPFKMCTYRIYYTKKLPSIKPSPKDNSAISKILKTSSLKYLRLGDKGGKYVHNDSNELMIKI